MCLRDTVQDTYVLQELAATDCTGTPSDNTDRGRTTTGAGSWFSYWACRCWFRPVRCPDLLSVVDEKPR